MYNIYGNLLKSLLVTNILFLTNSNGQKLSICHQWFQQLMMNYVKVLLTIFNFDSILFCNVINTNVYVDLSTIML